MYNYHIVCIMYAGLAVDKVLCMYQPHAKTIFTLWCAFITCHTGSRHAMKKRPNFAVTKVASDMYLTVLEILQKIKT